jgi:hypothetical protein
VDVLTGRSLWGGTGSTASCCLWPPFLCHCMFSNFSSRTSCTTLPGTSVHCCFYSPGTSSFPQQATHLGIFLVWAQHCSCGEDYSFPSPSGAIMEHGMRRKQSLGECRLTNHFFSFSIAFLFLVVGSHLCPLGPQFSLSLGR